MGPLTPGVKPAGSQREHPSTNTNAIPPARLRSHPKVTETDLLTLAYGIPSLHTFPDSPSSSNNSLLHTPRTSNHGRSMSHPFPALFQSKQKRQGNNDLNSSDPPSGENHTLPSLTQSRIPNNRSARPSETVLVIGKCMTCDSTVRWPKELSVFRCTVCSTINDLDSVSSTARSRNNPSNESYELPSSDIVLSSAKTRVLIENCIKSYLSNQFAATCESNSPGASISLEQGYEKVLLRRGNSHRLPSKGLPYPPGHASVCSPGIEVNALDENLPSFHHVGVVNGFLNSHSHSNQAEQDVRMQSATKNNRNLGHSDAPKYDQSIQQEHERSRNIFKPLEDYIITSFTSMECVNNSFITPLLGVTSHAASERTGRKTVHSVDNGYHHASKSLSEIDEKILSTGCYVESNVHGNEVPRSLKISDLPPSNLKTFSTRTSDRVVNKVSPKSPRIDWKELNEWYNMILLAGSDWEEHLKEIVQVDAAQYWDDCSKLIEEIGGRFMEAQTHIQRVLLKATESLLKRPGAPLKQPDDLRFLLIILANPLLCPMVSRALFYDFNSGPGQHSSIIKRVLGLLSNAPNECHHYLVAWFAMFSKITLQPVIEIVNNFVTYRLSRQNERQQTTRQDHTTDLVPSLSTTHQGTSAALYTPLSISGQQSRKSTKRPRPVAYCDDWQIRAAARVMALLFSANNTSQAVTVNTFSVASRETLHPRGQIIATSTFYNTLLDYSDLVADFEAWEAGRGKFSFCQYPFFLSIWAKIQIFNLDARRQMEVKAREAFFDSIMTRKTVNQYLALKVRRECLVEDSLRGVSEVVGSGGEEIKKALRIEFKGEEGIDAGGLRKEWFLLLVRDVFNPEHGMFVYDEDSHFCYFNPNSFETSDQYFLIGVVMGLAIYNSTILDVALPPFAFRKLLAAGPSAAVGGHAKPTMTYGLEDLAELRPGLANGLRQLLDYDGNVEQIFCRDFVIEVLAYGEVVQVPLCPNGEKRPVTNANRREFVELYIRYLLDIAVTRQFEPFQRGFNTVCAGNALSLFRPEEIELLIRGSDQPLDIASLKAVAVYENWGVPNPADTEPVIVWFWHTFHANPKDQRKLLSFITGSDRIPAMGATSLVIKLSCLGEDCSRYPIARTCFDCLFLWRYSSQQKLESMLWRAVYESEGFGLK